MIFICLNDVSVCTPPQETIKKKKKREKYIKKYLKKKNKKIYKGNKKGGKGLKKIRNCLLNLILIQIGSSDWMFLSTCEFCNGIFTI